MQGRQGSELKLRLLAKVLTIQKQLIQLGQIAGKSLYRMMGGCLFGDARAGMRDKKCVCVHPQNNKVCGNTGTKTVCPEQEL